MIPEINKLYEGDCLRVMKKWDDNIVDHAIVDPPYNMSKKNGLSWAYSSHVTMSEEWDIFTREEYIKFSKKWLKEITRLTKPNGNIFIFGSFHNIYDLGYLINDMDLRIINSIIWFKPNAQPNITCRTLTESTEYIIWACNSPKSKAKNWVFNYEDAKKLNDGKQMRNVWSIPYTPKNEKIYGNHPSQKPIDLLKRIILIATKPNDLILDCFAGTGTTGVVAQNLNRRWVMIEKNPDYIQIANERLKNVKVKMPEQLIQERLIK